jgi:hypothetical protein
MPYFQDASGNFHFLSAADIAAGGMSLLPPGSLPVTDAQASSGLAAKIAALQNLSPIVVDMWRAKAVLKQAAFTPSTAQATVQSVVATASNLLDAASALVAVSGNPTLEAFWQYASSIQSDDANLLTIAGQLNVAPATIISLFQQAKALTV